MQQQTIPLIPEKQPSAAEGRKKATQGHSPTEDLVFFNMSSLSSTLSSSEMQQKMYFGIAEFRDEPTELWRAHCWASSVRTTSGQFAHFLAESPQAGGPIFPSDFIKFLCGSKSCDDEHVGLVQSVGYDY